MWSIKSVCINYIFGNERSILVPDYVTRLKLSRRKSLILASLCVMLDGLIVTSSAPNSWARIKVLSRLNHACQCSPQRLRGNWDAWSKLDGLQLSWDTIFVTCTRRFWIGSNLPYTYHMVCLYVAPYQPSLQDIAQPRCIPHRYLMFPTSRLKVAWQTAFEKEQHNLGADTVSLTAIKPPRVVFAKTAFRCGSHFEPWSKHQCATLYKLARYPPPPPLFNPLAFALEAIFVA